MYEEKGPQQAGLPEVVSGMSATNISDMLNAFAMQCVYQLFSTLSAPHQVTSASVGYPHHVITEGKRAWQLIIIPAHVSRLPHVS